MVTPAPEVNGGADGGGWLSHLPQPVRYVLVGGFNTALGYGLFALCYLALDGRWPYAAILVLAHVLAVSFSFFTHRQWVFGTGNRPGWRPVALAWGRFQMAYVSLLLLGLAVNGVMLRWLTTSAWLAQGVATVVGVAAGYVLHRHFVFKTGDQDAKAV
jgi:putative flippase GtrA